MIPFFISQQYFILIDTTLLITYNLKQFSYPYISGITRGSSNIVITLRTKYKIKVITYRSSPCSQLLLYVSLPTSRYLQTQQTLDFDSCPNNCSETAYNITTYEAVHISSTPSAIEPSTASEGHDIEDFNFNNPCSVASFFT